MAKFAETELGRRTCQSPFGRFASVMVHLTSHALVDGDKSIRLLTFSPVRSFLKRGSRNQFILVGEKLPLVRDSGWWAAERKLGP
jgi:hypothetical protein